jgi:hypothetical protein
MEGVKLTCPIRAIVWLAFAELADWSAVTDQPDNCVVTAKPAVDDAL